MTTPVYMEGGERRVFACALDWPGWCRSGKDEQRALEALGASAPRYAVVAGEAGLDFPPGADFRFEVVERVEGSGATDFGIPDKLASTDHDPAGPEEVSRARALVAAAWAVFDRVVAGAPVELRKGPRGGGRDRDAIVEHVLAAEVGYARQLGVAAAAARRAGPGRLAKQPQLHPRRPRRRSGATLAAALRRPSGGLARARPRLGDRGPDPGLSPLGRPARLGPMLPPGTTLPEFTVLDHEGRPLHSRHLGGGWTVLWWYVKADTPG